LPVGLEVFWGIASRSFNRTLQYDAKFILSPRFWKWANSTPWESKTTVSITFPADGVIVTLNFSVQGELGCFYYTEARLNSGW
jgi:hypothetical protein